MRAILPVSALFFAGEYLGRVGTAAFLDAGFAAVKLRRGHHPTGAVGIRTCRKLPALVAELVLHGTDLRRILAAREIEAVTGRETAGRCPGFPGSHGRNYQGSCRDHNSQLGERCRDRPASLSTGCTTADEGSKDQECNTNSTTKLREFHGKYTTGGRYIVGIFMGFLKKTTLL